MTYCLGKVKFLYMWHIFIMKNTLMWNNIFIKYIYVVENEKQHGYHTVRTILKSNIKMIETDKISTPNTEIRERSPSWLCTGSTIKQNGVIKLYL
jgi:hypothetical protein